MIIDNELILMEKYKLTPNELFVIETVFIAAEESNLDYLIRFCSISESHKDSFRNTLKSLQEKGIILASYKLPKPGDTFNPEDVPFNKNFMKNLFKASFELGQELFDTYPTFTTINGAMIGIKGVAKKFDSIEQFFEFYGKQIRYNPEKHVEVIEITNWAKDHNLISESIASYVINHSWETFKAMRDGEGVNINPDAVRMI